MGKGGGRTVEKLWQQPAFLIAAVADGSACQTVKHGIKSHLVHFFELI